MAAIIRNVFKPYVAAWTMFAESIEAAAFARLPPSNIAAPNAAVVAGTSQNMTAGTAASPSLRPTGLKDWRESTISQLNQAAILVRRLFAKMWTIRNKTDITFCVGDVDKQRNRWVLFVASIGQNYRRASGPRSYFLEQQLDIFYHCCRPGYAAERFSCANRTEPSS